MADSDNTPLTGLMPTPSGETTMSSREIAELAEKRHDHVMRDIRLMLAELYGESEAPKFGGYYVAENGKQNPCFNLPKRETLILVSGYSIGMRARIIDRWQELEVRGTTALLPQTLPEALRLAADLADELHATRGQVEEMRPQVQALERIAVSDGSLCITDGAKTLQVQPKALFNFLDAHGWTYTRQGDGTRIAYQAKLQQGLLEHKTTTVFRTDGSEKTTTQVRITPKGLARLGREFPPVARAA